MSSKTRKLIWSVPLMATLAVVGALAVFVALGLPNANPAEAQAGEPGAPAAPTVTAGNMRVTVTWNAPQDDGGQTPEYRVRYAQIAIAPTGDTGWTVHGVEDGIRRRVIMGLANNNVVVHAQVQAFNDGGSGDWSPTGTSTDAPAADVPGKPTGVMVTQSSERDDTASPPNADAEVSWTAPEDNGGSDIIGYVVEVDQAGGTSFTGYTSTTQAALEADATADVEGFTLTTSMVVMDLQNGAKVRVTAINEATIDTGDLSTSEVDGATASQATSEEFVLEDVPDISKLNFVTGSMITSSTSTGSGSPRLTVTIPNLAGSLPGGSSIVLFLEDDFQEPESIPITSVYFIADQPRTADTGNGARVYATAPPKISTGAFFDATKKDIAIRVFIPDMCTDAAGSDTATVCAGVNGPVKEQRLVMVIDDNSGIKNPSELGTHSAQMMILAPADNLPSAGADDGVSHLMLPEGKMTPYTMDGKALLPTVAKVSLSDNNNARGYELLVTGTGFNDKTTATAYVMHAAVGADDAPETCAEVVAGGSSIGGALVGSDDSVSVAVTVSVPVFKPGKMNHICLLDGEGRDSGDDVEVFELEDSIRVVPKSVNAGDSVTIFAQDFAYSGATLAKLELQGTQVNPARAGDDLTSVNVGGNTGIGSDGSATITFEMPGSIDKKSLRGDIAVKAYWISGNNKMDAATTITVAPAGLTLSKTQPLPNESITIQGNGFGDGAEVDVDDITIDDVALMVDDDSQDDGVVDVSSGGQFVATVHLWPESGTTNPLLVSGEHTIKVVDNEGFVGTATITIPEPAINVVPAVAGPRDFINISGENWPVDNLSAGSIDSIRVTVSGGGRDRIYSALIDNSGRFNVEHRVASNVSIPSTNQIKVEYATEIVKISEYKVAAATITVEPAMAKPGDAVSLSVGGMPVHAPVDSITIGGRAVLGGLSFNTDRTGAVSAVGIVVPGLDPGTYAVQLDVGETVAIGSIDVQAEGVAGVTAALPGALEELGDSLVRVFHFNTDSKEWSFFDPRPEFEGLNTLTELAAGQPYWMLVSETVGNVVLNGKTRNLTCVGGDCWNQLVW